jgi:hypothetical protein
MWDRRTTVNPSLLTDGPEGTFYEVRILGFLGSSGHHTDIPRTGVPTQRDPGPGKVG